MDVQALKQEIESLLAGISDAGKKAQLQARLDDILKRHQAETDAAKKDAIAGELPALKAEAEAEIKRQGARRTGDGGPFLTQGAFAFVLMLTVFSFGFLVYYIEKLITDEMSALESVQFLLVLTLIVAMFGFGGLLIVRALFAPYDGEELQNRFRMGREIFLVFSGIFGTIIGFYFGSQDDADADGLQLDVGFAQGQVTAAVAGGSKPIIGIFTLAGQSGGVLMSVDERILSYKPADGTCPEGATIAVIDGRGRRAEGKVDCSAEDEGSNVSENKAEDAPETGDNTTLNKT